MLITPVSLSVAFIGFSLKYLAGLQSTVTQHEEMADVVTDAVGELDFPISEGFPAFRAWPEGKERVWHNLAAHNQVLKAEDYELSVKVPKNKFQDDRYGIFAKDFFVAGQNAKKVWDKILFDAIAKGETLLCYDGQPFFDADHPVRPSDANSATQSNKNTARPLTEENLELSLAQFAGWLAPDGTAIEIVPNEIWVGSANYWKAKHLISQATLANGADNIHKDTLKIRLVPGLGTSWILASTDQGVKPAVVFKREEADMIPLDADVRSPHVVEHREFRYAGTARGAAMLTLPCLAQLNKAA